MKGIRALSLSDSEEILRINSESLPGVARLDTTELERLISIPNEHLVIDGPERGLCGYLLAFRSDAYYDGEEFVSFTEMGLEEFIYIDQIAVDDGFRRAGLASTLYGVLEERAKDSFASYLCCEINLVPPNPTSLAFHRNKGFNQTDELRTRDGRTVALMTKRLVPTETGARET